MPKPGKVRDGYKVCELLLRHQREGTIDSFSAGGIGIAVALGWGTDAQRVYRATNIVREGHCPPYYMQQQGTSLPRKRFLVVDQSDPLCKINVDNAHKGVDSWTHYQMSVTKHQLITIDMMIDAEEDPTVLRNLFRKKENVTIAFNALVRAA